MREPLGLILAGGRGTRMGGVDKAALDLGGQSLLDRAIERLEPQVAALAVSANAPLDTRLPVLADATGGFLGPLAGVLAGLDWAIDRGASHLVTVAVDTPFFPCDLTPRLLLAGNFAVAATPDGTHGTFALWPVDLRDELAAFLNGGGRKVRDFLEAHGAVQAMFPATTPPSFFNVNTPDDLARAAAWA